jgi:Fur family transcriptional regulator, ferric uptake regulator
MTPPSRELSVDDAGELLKAAGLRKTFTRVSIVQCLARQSAPVTHAEVCDALSSHGFDSSTIFRGLNDLADAGIVTRLDLGDRTWRYELRTIRGFSRDSALQHPHAVCRKCGRNECLDPQRLLPAYEVLPDWRVEEILFKGVCRNCR